jgi:hypothetical protein
MTLAHQLQERIRGGLRGLIFGLLSALPAMAHSASEERFSVLEWSMAVETAIDARDAKTLQALLDYERLERQALSTRNAADRKSMRAARRHFEAGRINRALEIYETVPKSSDYWLESVEERAWGHLREGRVNQALALSRTLMVEPFVRIAGTEPFFLQSLAQLRVCDYKGILKTHSTFKDTQRERLLELQALSTRGQSPHLDTALARVDLFPVRGVDIGEPLRNLPRLFYRDRALMAAVFATRLETSARPVLAQLRASGLATAQRTRFETQLNRRLQRAPSEMRERMKILAARETQQSHRLVQKLNLIEVELVQRLHVDGQLPKESFSRGEFANTNSDQLVFPDDGRPWIDEVDKYEVRLNACPRNVRRRM